MTRLIERISLRGILGKWRGKRNRRRHLRSLEDSLRKMDPHTLNDIGLNALLDEASATESRAKSPVSVTPKKKTGRPS